jgi:hypothetical protein
MRWTPTCAAGKGQSRGSETERRLKTEHQRQNHRFLIEGACGTPEELAGKAPSLGLQEGQQQCQG